MSSSAATPLDFERFRTTFFEECAEILPELDERLSSLQAGCLDSECLNAIFRAVHSIGAGAAAFNLTALAGFAHIFEAMLDGLRSNRIHHSPQTFNVIVRAGDLLAELADAARDGRAVHEGFGAGVAAELQALLDAGQDRGQAASKDAAPPKSPALDGPARVYRIVFEPHRELFRHANEPLLIVRELRHLGELRVECDSGNLPDLVSLDPEDAYLSFVFHLSTHALQSSVAEAFEFVDQDCRLTIEEVSDKETESPSAGRADICLGVQRLIFPLV